MRRRSTVALAVVVALAAACSSDDGGGTAAITTIAPVDGTGSATSTGAPEPLTILVTNDDGIGAPGIDAVVTALQEMTDVEVVIVAPAENQSGTSDKTTDGPVIHVDATTASGVEGIAVAGFPADAVNVALDELGIEPDVVVSGVNQGQNIADLAPLSGTLGAARTAIRRGIPAVAASAGFDELADYDAGATLIVDWITEHRAEVAGGTADTSTVTSFNVPGCRAGEPKAVIEVPLAAVIPDGIDAFSTADCTIVPPSPPTDDVKGLLGGYLTVTQVPADL